MTGFEHQQIKGITVKNMAVTITSTVAIVVSVMGTYFNLKEDISGVRNQQETTNRVNDLRLKTLETRVDLLETQLRSLQDNASTIDIDRSIHPKDQKKTI
jgi:hypothetical protein